MNFSVETMMKTEISLGKVKENTVAALQAIIEAIKDSNDISKSNFKVHVEDECAVIDTQSIERNFTRIFHPTGWVSVELSVRYRRDQK